MFRFSVVFCSREEMKTTLVCLNFSLAKCSSWQIQNPWENRQKLAFHSVNRRWDSVVKWTAQLTREVLFKMGVNENFWQSASPRSKESKAAASTTTTSTSNFLSFGCLFAQARHRFSASQDCVNYSGQRISMAISGWVPHKSRVIIECYQVGKLDS